MKKIKSVVVVILGIGVIVILAVCIIGLLQKNSNKKIEELNKQITSSNIETESEVYSEVSIEGQEIQETQETQETKDSISELIVEPTRTTIDTPKANSDHPINKAVNGGNYVRLSDYPNTLIINDCEGYSYNVLLNTLTSVNYFDGRPMLIDSVTIDRDEGVILNVDRSNGYGNVVTYDSIPIIEDESDNWKSKIPVDYSILYSKDIGYVNPVE